MDADSYQSGGSSADPFLRFWTDAMARMSTAAMTQAFSGSPSQEEVAAQMRQAFFDAWAKACDEYLHSEAFLQMMKRTMDGAMTFREQMNRFLSETMNEGLMPSRDDTDSILHAVRTLEETVLERLADLTQRVDTMERSAGTKRSDGKANVPRAKGGAR